MVDIARLGIEVDTTDLRQGEVALESLGREAQRTEAKVRGMGTGVTQASNRLAQATSVNRNFGRAVQNSAFQVGDFAVQIASGQRASTALAQQLPQLLGGFGVLGAVFGAVVAIGAAVAPMFLSQASGARELKDALDELKDKTEEMGKAYRVFILGLGSVSELAVIDRLADLRREALQIEEEIARLSGRNRQAAVFRLDAVQAEIAGLNEQLVRLRQAEEQRDRMTKAVEETTDAERLLGEQMVETAQKAALLAYEIERSRDAAMAAASEFVKVQQLRSRFAGEDALMGQPVVVPGQGTPAPTTGGGATTSAAGGFAAAFDARTEALVEALMTERETVDAWYQESLFVLSQANEAELAAIGGQNEAKLRLEQEYQDRLSTIKEMGNQMSLQAVLGGGALVLGAMGAFNEKALRISQAFAAAEALVSTYQGAAKELSKGTLGFGTAALVLARGLAFVGAIKGINASSGGGGSISAPGPSSIPANANTSPRVALQLVGSENATFSKSQVRNLINAINQETEGGAIVRLS